MKKYLFIFGAIFICTTVRSEAYVFEPGDYDDIGSFNYEVIVVESGANIFAVPGQNIIITDTIDLYNYGTITGKIDTNGYNLNVYDTGIITNGITTQNGGNVTQFFNPSSGMVGLDVEGGNHIVNIDYNSQELSFNDIKDLPATSFSLSNASVMIDDFSVWQSWGQSVVLEGPVKLVIAHVDTVVDGDVINNIVGGADYLAVQITDLDSLHAINLTPYGQTKTLNLVHEPNNDVVISGNSGVGNAFGPLEQIRKNNPNDKLVKALDAANTEAEFNKIIHNSYRFHHDILLRPIKVINNFSSFNRLNDAQECGLGANVSYITSDTTGGLGGRVYAGNNFSDLYLNVGFNFYSFSYEDKLNDFSGAAYGLDIRAKQSFNDFWLDGLAGVTLVQYDADYITTNNKLKKSPFGSSEYIKIDAGHDFDVFPDLIVSPFVGIIARQYNVTDVSDFDLNVRGGADVKYGVLTDGIKYEYGVGGALSANGDWFSSVKVGFWSVVDKVGASFDAGILKNDIDYHYKLSANVKTVF